MMCATMDDLKRRHEAETTLANELQGVTARRHLDNAQSLYRQMMDHWDGCNECQGLAVVAEPAVDLGGVGVRKVLHES